MKGTVLYGERDIRFEDRPEPTIAKPTDASISLPATCICGSDLWPYRGIQPIAQPTPMGHEYCGIVEEVGKEIRNIKPGQFVVGSFATSDNTCSICRHGYQSSCVQREFMSTAQAPYLRVPLADGTLVATSDLPPKELIPSLLATSDVLCTGWFAADAANVKPGSTVLVVGDGAVGLLGVLSAKQMGAERIIAMSRHASRQKLAREFGATDIVTERGDEGVERIKALTKGVGADAVLECVGTQESMMQATHSTRPGGSVGYVGVPHGVELDGEQLFYAHVRLHGGPAPVRRFLPNLIDRSEERRVGKDGRYWRDWSSDVCSSDLVGADAVLECVGTQESMMQATHSTRPGGSVGYVGVPHGVELDGEQLFYAHVRLHGGPAPVRRFLPNLID